MNSKEARMGWIRRLLDVLRGIKAKAEATVASELCICCHKNPVTWPRVCDACQDHDAQDELLAYFGDGHECRTCGMIYDGGMRCTYCGDEDPLDQGDAL